jgi:hypothetical protein
MIEGLRTLYKTFFAKAKEGDSVANGECMKIIDKLMALYGLTKDQIQLLFGGDRMAEANKILVIRFRSGEETVLKAGGSESMKTIEHQPAIDRKTEYQSEPMTATDYTNTDNGEFARRRVEQKHAEFDALKLEQRAEVANVTVGPLRHQDAALGGSELKGSCDYVAPKPRRERIIG